MSAYMFGQLAPLPEPVPVVAGAAADGVVVAGVVVVAVAAAGVVVDVLPAAFATATTPPPSAPVQASVASNLLARVLIVEPPLL
jgi:hypothetical protein